MNKKLNYDLFQEAANLRGILQHVLLNNLAREFFLILIFVIFAISLAQMVIEILLIY